MGCCCSSNGCRCCCCLCYSDCCAPTNPVEVPTNPVTVSTNPAKVPIYGEAGQGPEADHRHRAIIESSIVVYLDISIDGNSTGFQLIKDMHQVVNMVQPFTDTNKCLTYISNVKDAKILLVILDLLVEKFVPLVSSYKNLESVYVLNSHKTEHKDWHALFPIVRGLYSSSTDLCKTLKHDARQIDHDNIGIEAVNQPLTSDGEKDNTQQPEFMYLKIFLDMILALEEDDVKRTMIDFLSKVYAKKLDAITLLQNLRTTYTDTKAINAYSADGCVYQALNKAIYSYQYGTLFHFRVYIRHLDEAIRKKSRTQKALKWPPFLYRGQVMEKEELKRRCGTKGLWSIASFLSTSSEEKVALGFAQPNNINDTRKIGVLMKITIEKHVKGTPFAFIKDEADIPEEEEWLFTMGSVFRIGQVTQMNDSIWQVDLTWTDERDERLFAWQTYIETYLRKEAPYLSLGKLMFQLGEWETSELYYLLHSKLEKASAHDATVLNNRGLIQIELKEYEKAIDYFNQSIEPDGNPGIRNRHDYALYYNNLATVYFKQNEILRAKEYVERALDMLNDVTEGHAEMKASLYHKLGSILHRQERYDDALSYYNKCLKIRNQIHLRPHPILANTYNSMAETYLRLGSYRTALEYAKQAVAIDKQTLPRNHFQSRVHIHTLEVIERFEKGGT